MFGDDIEHLKDWTKVPFTAIAKHLLANGKCVKCIINDEEGIISILEVNGIWHFEHPGLPGESVTVFSNASACITPETVTP